jgi:hypothetical protein
VGNGHIFMSKGSLERGEKRLPRYVANSFLDHHGWGRILFGPVIFIKKKGDIRVALRALMAMQESSEAYLAEYFQDFNLVAIHPG